MFKSPFSFEGRIRRLEYGLSVLAYVVGGNLISFLINAGEEYIVVEIILYLPMLWFIFAQGAKRCHDVGSSGWFQIIPFYSLYMLFGEGVKGQNKYGKDPKELERESSPDVLDDDLV